VRIFAYTKKVSPFSPQKESGVNSPKVAAMALEEERKAYGEAAKEFVAAMKKLADASQKGTAEYKKASYAFDAEKVKFDVAKDNLSAAVWGNMKPIGKK